jgi:predicted Zn-dependent protease with MMP-like domain
LRIESEQDEALDPERALAEALDWIEEEPNNPDAHYEAGIAYEELGEEAERRREFVEVLRLDALSEQAPLPEHDAIICDEVEATLAELPAHINERLGAVAILVEPRPSLAAVKDGVDPRLLGLFEGATSEELSGPDAPLTATRIQIFSHNLASAFADEASLRSEVRVTVLHEIGHFFGLEEEDMERLGLE